MRDWIIQYKDPLYLVLSLLILFIGASYSGFLHQMVVAFGTNSSALGIIGIMLAITFTNYSLLFLVLPHMSKEDAKRAELTSIGYIFLFTIYLEVISVMLGVLVTRLWDGNGNTTYWQVAVLYTFSFLLSFLMIVLLSYYMFLLFERARSSLSNRR